MTQQCLMISTQKRCYKEEKNRL